MSRDNLKHQVTQQFVVREIYLVTLMSRWRIRYTMTVKQMDSGTFSFSTCEVLPHAVTFLLHLSGIV